MNTKRAKTYVVSSSKFLSVEKLCLKLLIPKSRNPTRSFRSDVVTRNLPQPRTTIWNHTSDCCVASHLPQKQMFDWIWKHHHKL